MSVSALFRARWYTVTHTVTLWGFLALTAAVAALLADSTARLNEVSALSLSAFVLGLSLLWFVAFLGYDEKVGVLANCLVAPSARTGWVLAGLLCYVAGLAGFIGVFLAATGVTLAVNGSVPPVDAADILAFARFLLAFAVVAVAYGCVLAFVMAVVRRTVLGVLALWIIVGGFVEGNAVSVLTLAGAGELARVWGPCTLFGQFCSLAMGCVPPAGATLLAGGIAVVFALLAVAMTRRRRVAAG